MRSVILTLLSLSCVYANELIFVSNDTGSKSLEHLEQKYRQNILVNDKRAYLIPSACLLERYFAGASEGELNLITSSMQTETVYVTQEIFEAKNEEELSKKIEVKRSVALIEGKSSKAFLDDKEGRGFGGTSQTPLDFSFQKIEATSVNMVPSKVQKPIIENAVAYKHPRCKLLGDGSGYQLSNIKNAQFYSKEGLLCISKNTILFN